MGKMVRAKYAAPDKNRLNGGIFVRELESHSCEVTQTQQ